MYKTKRSTLDVLTPILSWKKEGEKDKLTGTAMCWNKGRQRMGTSKKSKKMSFLSEPTSSLPYYKKILPPLNVCIAFFFLPFSFSPSYNPFFHYACPSFLSLSLFSFLSLAVASVLSACFLKFKLKYQS